jgi:hypothetical protein
MEVNHIDFNRLNPTRENLEYVTRAQNNAHSRGAGRMIPPRGEQQVGHKLTDEIVREIRSANGTLRSLAAHYGVAHSIIHRIRKGEDWPHVGQKRDEILRVLE